MISSSGTGVSTDTITITSVNDISPTYSYNYQYDYGQVTLSGTAGQPVYSISTGASSDTITLNSTDISAWSFNFPEEWQNSFPNWDRVKDMCGKYPGLKIAFENFKVVYEMVKDDYDNPVPKK